MFEGIPAKPDHRLSGMFLPAIGDVLQLSIFIWNARQYCPPAQDRVILKKLA
jgi:hypothetical protein